MSRKRNYLKIEASQCLISREICSPNSRLNTFSSRFFTSENYELFWSLSKDYYRQRNMSMRDSFLWVHKPRMEFYVNRAQIQSLCTGLLLKDL